MFYGIRKNTLPVATGKNINVMANTSMSDERNTLMMYEMPTTLSSIQQAVNLSFTLLISRIYKLLAIHPHRWYFGYAQYAEYAVQYCRMEQVKNIKNNYGKRKYADGC